MQHIKNLTFLLVCMSLHAYGQNSNNVPTASLTIAYGSDGICLTNLEGSSNVRLTTGSHGYPAWSPDGKHLAIYAYHDGKKTWSIHTIDKDGANFKRLTHVKNKWDNMPSWSPDGKKIVFAREYKDSAKNWYPEIWIMNADGREQTQLKALRGGGPCFMPDGRIVFHSEYKDKESEISIANADGSHIIHLTNNEAEEWDPKISPDGKQIAFTSDRHGSHEIYIINVDGTNEKRLTNNAYDDYGPTWSPDGQQLVFQSNREEHSGLFKINIDGSSEQKLISNGWQPAWFHASN